MSNTPNFQCLIRWMAAAAAAFLFAALYLPLWQLRMESPQYRDQDALRVSIHPGSMRGDLKEITVLNQYIGVHIPAKLPQLDWLPIAFVASAVLALKAGFTHHPSRHRLLAASALLLVTALIASAALAQYQMYNIGHKRDAKTKLVGVKDFTPPLFGRVKVANFQISSWLGAGAYLAGTAVALELAAALASKASSKSSVEFGSELSETIVSSHSKEITA